MSYTLLRVETRTSEYGADRHEETNSTYVIYCDGCRHEHRVRADTGVSDDVLMDAADEQHQDGLPRELERSE